MLNCCFEWIVFVHSLIYSLSPSPIFPISIVHFCCCWFIIVYLFFLWLSSMVFEKMFAVAAIAIDCSDCNALTMNSNKMERNEMKQYIKWEHKKHVECIGDDKHCNKCYSFIRILWAKLELSLATKQQLKLNYYCMLVALA